LIYSLPTLIYDEEGPFVMVRSWAIFSRSKRYLNSGASAGMREIDSFFYLRLALINFAAMPKMLTVFFA